MLRKVLLTMLCLAMVIGFAWPGAVNIQAAGQSPVISPVPEGHVRIHYLRTDREYEGWGLHLWGNGYNGPAVDWGNPMPYTSMHDYGVYWDVPYKQGTGDLNFIVHKGDSKDPDGDRKYPDPDTVKEVYCITGNPTIFTDFDEALKTLGVEKLNVAALADGFVRLHYFRQDGNYAGWGLHLWGEGYGGPAIDWGKAMEPTGKDTFGVFWDIAYKGAGGLSFIIHKGDDKDTANDREFVDPAKNRELWAVSGEAEGYVSRANAMKAMSNKIDRAVILGPRTIEVVFRAPIKEALRVKDGKKFVPLAELDTSREPIYTVTLRDDLDLSKNYTIECGKMTATTMLTPKVIDDQFTYTGQLGNFYTAKSTTFKLWAPLASDVKLLLFNKADAQNADTTVPMVKSVEGVWSVTVQGNLVGKFYQYAVTNAGVTKAVLDPYARSMAEFNSNGADKVGKGAIVDLAKTNPTGWEKDKYVSVKDQEDVIIYEMSVRDFTIAANSGVAAEKRGTYLGFIQKIPHLKELGVTHVQLMPIQNFYYGNEVDKAFENKGSAGEANYNWGYDPHNYNTPEGWYSTNPNDPQLRINEVKQLVKALHDAGIGVIMDVVYNHTANTSILEDIVPNYYYRRNDKGNFTSGSGCGNDTASERTMWRKFMVESTKYWVQEYHIDGFRFDLMGLHDETTMKEIAKTIRAVNPSATILGEGWDMGTLPEPDRYIKAGTTNHSLVEMEHAIAVFNDTLRDAMKHGFYASPLNEGTFIQAANPGKEPLIRAGIIAGMVDYTSTMSVDTGFYNRFADDPEETITYSDCHDGYTIWDKIVGSTPNYTEAERIRVNKLAAAMIFTSQGISFFHGGQEILRSKPDPDNITGVDSNSYDSGDLTNQFDWSRKSKCADSFKYYQGLIALRKGHEAFRMETMAEIQKGLIFTQEDIDYLLGFKLVEQNGTDPWKEIVVIFNANKDAKTVKVDGVNAKWVVVVDGVNAGVTPLAKTDVKLGEGTVVVPGLSAVVIHK